MKDGAQVNVSRSEPEKVRAGTRGDGSCLRMCSETAVLQDRHSDRAVDPQDLFFSCSTLAGEGHGLGAGVDAGDDVDLGWQCLSLK
jgi:hypothetical protein